MEQKAPEHVIYCMLLSGASPGAVLVSGMGGGGVCFVQSRLCNAALCNVVPWVFLIAQNQFVGKSAKSAP